MKCLLVVITILAVSAATVGSARPADHPLTKRILNGCTLHSLIYLAKVGHGTVETVTTPGGVDHSVAVVADDEGVWARDEYLGVFQINPDRKNLQRQFNNAFHWADTATEKAMRRDGHELTSREKAEALTLAHDLLRSVGIAAEITDGTVIFQHAGHAYIYGPEHGTIQARTAMTGHALVAAARNHWSKNQNQKP